MSSINDFVSSFLNDLSLALFIFWILFIRFILFDFIRFSLEFVFKEWPLLFKFLALFVAKFVIIGRFMFLLFFIFYKNYI